MMAKSVNSEKLDAIISQARSESLDLSMQAFGSKSKPSINIEKIGIICERLLKFHPPIKPTYASISEEGLLFYGDFCARQTLKNTYRTMIAPWVSAYFCLVRIEVEKVSSLARPRQSKSTSTDIADDIVIKYLQENIARLTRENDRLRHVISNSAPLQGQVKPALSPIPIVNTATEKPKILNLAPVRDWIRSLQGQDSLLEIADVGLRLTTFARPGRTIMGRHVLEIVMAM